jgi:N-acetylglucosaminyldiphosphoundecaprenol N-acetyl-beta-D-mannosaminyltransferase
MLDVGTSDAGQDPASGDRGDRRSAHRAQPGARRVEILGCPVDALDLSGTADRCLELMERNGGARQVSVNAAKLTSFNRDQEIASFIKACDVISADGQSVVWASRVLGRPLPERVPGIELMFELLEAANQRRLRVYILGSRDPILATAVRRIRAAYPGARVVGTQHGYFPPEDEDQVVASIRSAKPDILFVAMSSPRKERWLGRNNERIGARFAMGVGGAIDVLAGERSRAPEWLQALGLEWMHRLIQEPGRMWRRYLVGNLHFVWLVLRERARPGFRGPADV